ncbi:MAG TPA: hypothetical protein VFF61_01795 [Microvirga sp.]|nr:hypothetical protein [Microvirga sp.]
MTGSAKLSSDINEVIASPEVAGRLARLGYDLTSRSQAQIVDFAKAEVAKWSEIVRAAGVTVE